MRFRPLSMDRCRAPFEELTWMSKETAVNEHRMIG